jgi:membrane-bound serine protease (ClpP class)
MIEVFISSLGILAVAGVIAFITGSILLLDIISPGYHISWSLITMMTVFTVGFFLLIITLSIRAQQRKINSGREGMIGATGSALEYLHGHWLVSIDDEIWEANSPTELKPGQKIRVLKITGLILTVEPLRTKKQREAVKTL